MKKLILICGANGIGKSTACKALTEALDKTAYIDSDWCRFIHPFAFTDETIAVVKSNILALMLNYFSCSIVETVVFQYGFHGPRKQLFDDLLQSLRDRGVPFAFCPVILECSEEENIARMKRDGRDGGRIARAVRDTRHIYAGYDYPRIDTTHLTVMETVEKIKSVLNGR